MNQTGDRKPDTKLIIAGAALLMATTLMGESFVHAEDRERLTPAGTVRIAQADSVAFDIPPQSLRSALTAFAEQSGWQLFYSAQVAEGLRSAGLSGSAAPEAALKQLLAGTGLDFRITEPRTVTLVEAPAITTPAARPPEHSQVVPQEPQHGTSETAKSKPVKVPEIVVKEVRMRDDANNYVAEEASTATRTDTQIKDIPQSIEVVTRKVMDDQKAIRIEQAIRNVSGVFMSVGGGNTNEQAICRGFPCGFFKNGLRNDLNAQNIVFRETANLQRLEVLKGPASVLYGRSEPGGVINLLTKQPLPDRYVSLETIFGSYNFYRPTLDVSTPLNEDKTVLLRVNGAYENSGSFRDFVTFERKFIAPVVTWKLSGSTTLTLEGEYIHDNRTSESGLVAVGDRPAPIPISRFLNEQFASSKTNEARAGAILEHRFNDNWLLRSAFRADTFDQKPLIAFPLFLGPDNRTLNRILFGFQRTASSYYLRNDLVGKLTTGPIAHTLLTGVEIGRETLRLNSGSVPYSSIDIFSPVYSNTQLNVPYTSFTKNAANALGLYVQDQIKILENLQILGGVRWDLFHQTNTTGNVQQDREDSAVSPRVGIVYQPFQPISVYVNYTKSFQPTLTGGASQFTPTTGTQYEAGVKAVVVPDRLTTTIAVYRIEKKDVVTTNPSNPLLFIQAGEQRSQGIELDVNANLLPGWNVIASYAYTDARITNDNQFAVGNRLFNVARNSGSVWTTYDLQSGIFQGAGGGIGLFAQGDRTGDLRNSYELPGYVRADAALYYRKQEIMPKVNLVVSLNVRNLFNQQYYDSTQGSRTVIDPGMPFMALGSIKLEFY